MNVKLTKRKAWELISRIQPRLNIKQEATPSDVAIFKASTGPEGLEIRCENDWFNHNGRIKLTIGNVDGGTPIIRYYYPKPKTGAPVRGFSLSGSNVSDRGRNQSHQP